MKRRTFHHALLAGAIWPVVAPTDHRLKPVPRLPGVELPAIAAPALPSRLVVDETVWRGLLRDRIGVVERRFYDGQPKTFLFATLEERERVWREKPPQEGAPGQIEIFEVPVAI